MGMSLSSRLVYADRTDIGALAWYAVATWSNFRYWTILYCIFRHQWCGFRPI